MQPFKLGCTVESTFSSVSNTFVTVSPTSEMGDQIPQWFTSWNQQVFTPFTAKVNEGMSDLRTRGPTLETMHQNLGNTRLLTNTVEMRISGIPKCLKSDYTAAVTKVLAIHYMENLNCVASVCKWSVPNSSTSNNQNSTVTDNSLTLVIRAVSPTIRNSILSKSYLLRKKTANTIFGAGAHQKIYKSAI